LGWRRLAGYCTAVLGLGVLPYAGYVALAWWRYGRTDRPGAEPPDALLERFMPRYEVAERHQIRVAAPAEVTFAAARALDIQRSPLVRALFELRTLPSLLRGERQAREPRALLDETLSLGWGVLADVPNREIVVGAVTQPWEPVVQFRAVPPDQFGAFDQPGFAKIAWTLRADPLGPAASLFRTETRVQTTGPVARQRFRRYWALFSPGILLIRYETLRLLKREAERRQAGPGP
jgi:hypothetical protein